MTGSTAENFMVDQNIMNIALINYDKALDAKDQAETADIPVKVSLGKADAYLALYFSQQNDQLKEDYSKKAITQYQYVIEQFEYGNNIRIQELASEAHARLGLIARENQQTSLALEEYTKAQKLGSDPWRVGLYWATLADLNKNLGQNDESIKNYQNAIQVYKSAVKLTSRPERKAETMEKISRVYENMADKQNAERALREAINYLPSQSPTRQYFESLLATLQPENIITSP